MAYFPFMMDISGKTVIIAGGGHSALWKVRAFQGFGADVLVIAPEISEEIEQFKGIRLIRREVQEKDLEHADILVAATDDRELNRKLAELARSHGILANAVDDKEMCDFIFPAIVRRENYTVAISTDGKSPLLAREIKKAISRSIPDAYDKAVGELGAVRQEVKSRAESQSERQKIFAQLAEKYIGSQKLRIGTRGSELAMIQTEMVMDALQSIGIESEAVVIKTMGDKVQNKPLWKFGGKAVFVTDFEDAILKGKIDLAVHSAKDMPAACPAGTAVLACLKREDVRDVLVYRKGTKEADIKVAGTSSLRRKVQLKRLYPDLQCEVIRGNVPTRLHKLRTGEYDAVILAAAGIHRLQLDQEPDLVYRYLDPENFIPAAGQAIIAVEGPAEGDLAGLIRGINDRKTFIELSAERRFMKDINAGCHEAVGALAQYQDDGSLKMKVMKDYSGKLFVHSIYAQAEQAADILAEKILSDDPEAAAGAEDGPEVSAGKAEGPEMPGVKTDSLDVSAGKADDPKMPGGQSEHPDREAEKK